MVRRILDKTEAISVTKNQALGMGGVGVAITTIVALTSTFLTTGDKDALQTQMDAIRNSLQVQVTQNRAAIQDIKEDLKEGFRLQRIELKGAVKDIELVLRENAKDQWTSLDHKRFEINLNDRLKRLDRRINDLEQTNK